MNSTDDQDQKNLNELFSFDGKEKDGKLKKAEEVVESAGYDEELFLKNVQQGSERIDTLLSQAENENNIDGSVVNDDFTLEGQQSGRKSNEKNLQDDESSIEFNAFESAASNFQNSDEAEPNKVAAFETDAEQSQEKIKAEKALGATDSVSDTEARQENEFAVNDLANISNEPEEQALEDPAEEETGETLDDGEVLVSNSAPTDITLSSSTISEFAQAGDVVGHLSITDNDSRHEFDITLSGEGAEYFSVNGHDIVVREGVTLNHEVIESLALNVTVTDMSGNEYSEEINITIVDENDQPILNSVELSGSEGSLLQGQLNATDEDNDSPLMYSLSDGVPDISGFILNEDGSYSFDSADEAYEHLGTGDSEVITIPVTVTDEQGASDTAQIQITVNGTNDKPVADAVVITSVSEGDSAIAGQLTSSDVDDNSIASYAISDGSVAPDGFTLNADGRYSFDPSDSAYESLNVGDSQLLTIPITVVDDQGDTGITQIQITVSGTNDVPQISITNTSTSEDATVLIGNVNDIDGSIDSSTLQAEHGTVTVSESGEIKYTPDENFNGVDSVSLSFTDDTGETRSLTIPVNVSAVNDDVAQVTDTNATANEVVENQAAGASTGVTLNAIDVDGDAITYSVAEDVPFAVNADGEVVTTEALNFEATESYTFDVTATSSDGSTSTESITINVNDIDDVIVDTTANLVTDTGSSTTDNLTKEATPTIEGTTEAGATVVINDADGHAIGTGIADANGHYSITTSELTDGAQTLSITATDVAGNASTTTQDIEIDTKAEAGTVTVASITADNVVNASEDDADITVSGTAVGGDISTGDAVSFTVNGTDYSTTVQNDGSWSIDVAGADLAADTSFDVSVASSDTAGNTTNSISTSNHSVDNEVIATPTVTITEDTNNDGTINFAELSDAINISISIPIGAAAGDTINITDGSNSQSIIITDQMVANGEAVTSFVAPADGATFNVNAYITDVAGNSSSEGSDSAGLSLNRGPMGVDDTAITNEDTAVTLNVSDLLANDTDADSDALNITEVTATADTHGTVALDDDGNIVFTPEAEYSGEASFNYTISDGNGGSDTAAVTLNVEMVNDSPVISITDTTITEDEAQVIGHVSDIDGTIDSSTLSAEHGTVSVNDDGEISYTPDADYNGTDSVSLSFTDDGGATTTQTINLTIDPTQDNPIAVDDTSTYVTTDIQIDNASFESTSLSDGGWDRTIDNWDQSGVSGEFNTATRHMTDESTEGDNIAWINSGNISQTLSDTLSENSTYTLSLDLGDRADINAGDYSVALYAGDEVIGVITQEDFPLQNDSFTTVTLTVDTSNLAVDFNGYGQPLTIQISKESGTQLNVDNVQMSKTSFEGTEAEEDTVLTIQASDLLANDTDADGDTLSITEVTATADTHGTVSLDGDGNVVFTPETNYNGEASFEYTMSDGTQSDTATVTLNVDAVNDDISVVSDSDTAANTVVENVADGTYVGVTLSATDIDGDAISYSIDNDVPFSVGEDGRIVTNGDIDFETNESFTFDVTATSADGSTSIQEITIDVNDIDEVVAPDSPVITQAIDSNTLIGTVGNDADSVTIVVKDSDGNVVSEHNASIDGNNWHADFDKPTTGHFTVEAVATNSAGDSSESNTVNINVGTYNENITDSDSDINIVFDGSGHNTITTGSGDDVFDVNAGNDTFNAGSGDDTFLVEGSGDGYNRFRGGEGDDIIQGSAGDDTIKLKELNIESSIETIDGGAGNNTIEGGGNTHLDFSGTRLENIDSIRDGDRHNTITGNDQGLTFDVNAGNDTFNAGSGDDTFLVEGSGDGYNRFRGGEGDDIIQGSAGDDTIKLKELNIESSIETIDGGAGNNTIEGGGNTHLDFSGTRLENIDSIQAGRKDNTVTGSSGNDKIDGGRGNDTLVLTGDRSDYFISDNGDDSFTVDDLRDDSPQGTDIISNFETFKFADGPVNEENLIDTNPDLNALAGSVFVANITADDVVNSIEDDSEIAVSGTDGDDVINAGQGNDTIHGGAGDDVVTGGDGSDTYFFNPFDGNDTFHGGDGGAWTDVIHLDATADPGADPSEPWTITVDGQEVEYDLAAQALALDPDSAGVISLSDGSELIFDGVEKIEW